MWTLFVFFLLHFPLLDSLAGAVNLQRPFNNSVPAILVFGDSTVDPGNNNYVATPFRSNFQPYGRDFVNSIPTGRFSDGRLVTDFFASYVGIKENVPPYLQRDLSIQDLMTGVSFASAGSRFDPLTAKILNVIPIQRQLEYFREYKRRIEVAIGKERAEALIRKSAFLISAGTNDIVINYCGTPFRRLSYDLSSYLQFLLQNVHQFIQGLREEGAEIIAVVGLPPMGCITIVITLTVGGNRNLRRPCTDSLSSIGLDYNHKLQKLLKSMQNSSLVIVYADIYKALNDLIQKPAKFGFEKASTGCCGSGLVETTFLCNPKSPVCPNPSKYVFFDSIHPSEASYKYIFEALRPTIDQVLKNYHF